MTNLGRIPPGTPVVVGERVVVMPEVREGDQVIAVARTGEILVIPADAREAASVAVRRAHEASRILRQSAPTQVTEFFGAFARQLEDPAVWTAIAEANRADVEDARRRGRGVSRLTVSDGMRRGMVDGLRTWASTACRVGEIVERREDRDYVIERRVAPLGVIAFVFEARPNVFVDAVGVLRNGNTAVMRIGADALRTAHAIEAPMVGALRAAGLPEAAVSLVRSTSQAAGQALFTSPHVRLAVARGSGATVALLGSIAEQHGIPASLHGTGGAWLYVDRTADPEAVENAVVNSLDRKVCNTLNVLLLDRSALSSLGPVCARALARVDARVHVVAGSEGVIDGGLPLAVDELSTEWEWDTTPELSFVLVDGLEAAAALTNRYSPRFVASILSGREEAFQAFYDAVEAPYVGNGFTRWVDGQWAWQRPELGLGNWEHGRLLGRSGILSSDQLVTVRDVFLDRTGRAPQRR